MRLTSTLSSHGIGLAARRSWFAKLLDRVTGRPKPEPTLTELGKDLLRVHLSNTTPGRRLS